MILKEETLPEVKGNKEKIIEEEKEEEKEEETEEGEEVVMSYDYPPNPNQFNIKGSIPLFPQGSEPREWEKQPPTPEEIKEKIKELEKVSKSCVSTIGEGNDCYWVMSKDLETQVDGLFHKIALMLESISEHSAQIEFLTMVVNEQHKMLVGIGARFMCISTTLLE